MILSKTGRLSIEHNKFTIEQNDLEYVYQYKYLGAIISSNGRFSVAKIKKKMSLSLKTSSALFFI